MHGGRAERLRHELAAREPAATAAGADVRMVRAPGRVNLIGEHTDYNLGFVMPAAITLETWIAAVALAEPVVRLTSLENTETREFALPDPGPRQGEWIDYPAGVAWALGQLGVPLRGVAGVIDSTIPLGSGLSSSAALELAAAWTLSAASPPPLAPMELARAAQRGENVYVGVNCGLMDQFASVFGRAGEALLLDCRSLEHRSVALPAGHVLVALDTRSPHRLEASQYNARRAQCEAAVAALAACQPGVHSLRDVDEPGLDRLAQLVDEETLRRCTHVVRENERVLATLAALESGDLEQLGRLFAESHASLRDLYEVSSPELDALVAIAVSVPGVVGARMTGAGFGGCTVNL
ncbi:MAG TPA: galactokinase, partial [Candidatus Limnocylindria bacterium]|nr:galactokinase [Candidatus Limnocylindria bacterium]